ncbi:MAG: DJ-1/PfpI family protein [Verrucomicrobia bacterium]|nr:DJ-1/PfpI family protein [Verrucomicrobiota bacterium]MBI3868911.1 DJ-1/PfpI family protein [Verrucomicrobiota bacterium]
MPKILMPIGDAVEALDTFYAYYRLPEDGYEVVVAGPEARLYHTVLHEIPPNPDVPWDITQERPGYHLQASIAFRDLRAEDYAGLFVSGGRAPEYLRYHPDLLRVVREIVNAGKPVACLCHGIEILSAAGCIGGKRVTTVPKCALDARQGGGTYVNEPWVLDGLLITGRGYQDNTVVLKEFIRMLKASAA